VGLISAAGAAQVSFGQSAPAKKTQVFVRQNYLLNAGSQGARLTDYLSKTYLPALAKVHTGPTLVLEATLAPHLPQVTVLTGYQSVEEMWGLRAKLDGDKALEAVTDRPRRRSRTSPAPVATSFNKCFERESRYGPGPGLLTGRGVPVYLFERDENADAGPASRLLLP